jgi:Arc/MetJ-type ribon-helix-helix transcriptional regulator
MTEPKYIRVVDGIPRITLTEHEHIANKLRELLAEAYADADEVLRPYVKRLEDQLAESQAREAKLRDYFPDKGVYLAGENNDTALKEALKVEYQRGYDDGFLVGAEKGRNFSEEIKQAKREALLEAATKCDEDYRYKVLSKHLRKMAGELK